jgi:hypothetical protein
MNCLFVEHERIKENRLQQTHFKSTFNKTQFNAVKQQTDDRHYSDWQCSEKKWMSAGDW